jgi:hypothetical protein
MIDRGSVTVDGVKFPVTEKNITPEDIKHIIDFEYTRRGSDDVFIVSKKRFKDITGDYVPSVTSTRESKRANRWKDMGYMQEIMIIGDDDERYMELTPIEVTVYNFLSEYFIINDDRSIEEPKQEFINRPGLSGFYASVYEKGVTGDDFLSVLYSNKPETQYGSLSLKQRMFDHAKIIRWNALHAHRSIIVLSDDTLTHLDRESVLKRK